MRMRDTIEEENPGRISAFLSDNPTENGEFIAWMRTARLTDRQQDVLSRFFGVSREKSEPLERIADDYALSRERIRQIKEKALEKMRDSSRSMVT
jgi:RNA polymerase primary sigma factor